LAADADGKVIGNREQCSKQEKQRHGGV